MDDSKVPAFTTWPKHTTVKELQRFWGFTNFYWHFSNKISNKAINFYLHSEKSFHYSPHPLSPWPVQTLCLGRHLWHQCGGNSVSVPQGQAQAPPSRILLMKTSTTKRYYDVGDHDLLAIMLALKEWLEGETHLFTIFTDHKNLEFLRTAKLLNACQECWALVFTKFHFTLH